MARVLVAMSGGVDSSTAAYLLREQGHECAGVTMVLHHDCMTPAIARDLADASAVAARLGLDHTVLDLREQFDELVVQAFADAYEAGRTPNPCFGCNRRVKFGLLLDYALEQGFDYLATGHYARVEHPDTGAPAILRCAADRAKDQSYFLGGLSREQLSRTLFPLGGCADKAHTRAIAEAQGFPTAHKQESQDICFVPDNDYLGFLVKRRGAPYPDGPIFDRGGTVVGTHHGVPGYTIGQRKGLGVALGEPVYVCAKDATANTVTVGPLEALDASGCVVEGWHWLQPLDSAEVVGVKTHYRQAPQPARITELEPGRVRIDFVEPVRAVAPGQAAVAYRGDTVVGGGVIAEALATTPA